MRGIGLVLLVVLLAGAGPAAPAGRIAGRVTVTAAGEAQQDASGVVVYVTGFRESPPPPRAPAPEMMQRGRRFDPPLLAITAGQEVSFPNADPFFHNVFSLSPGQKFDLGQYRRGESKHRLFKELGPVEVYCNIHPEMAATILVLPNQRFAMTARDGAFVIDGVPAGTWQVYAYDRRASSPVSTEVTVAGEATAEVSFTVERSITSFPHRNKYGEEYREDGKPYR